MARSSRLPSPNPPSPSSSANASPRNSRCSGRRKALIGSCRPEPAPSTVLCATCSPPGIRPCPPTMFSLPHSLSQPEQPPTVSVALLRLLDRRFHGVPEDYRTQVLAANAEQLDAWIDAVLDAESIDAVFGGPTAH